MQTFAEFLAEAARKGEAVNTSFEERLFDLVGVLHRISGALEADDIPHEVIGGLGALIHVEEAGPEHSTLTRDVDLRVRRQDLELALPSWSGPVSASASDWRAVWSRQSPGLAACRDKDRVHVRSMDAAKLITAAVEASLPAALRERLAHVRATE